MNQGLKTGTTAAYRSCTPWRLPQNSMTSRESLSRSLWRLEYMRDMRRRNLYFALAMVVSGEYTPPRWEVWRAFHFTVTFALTPA